jgi:hypothetical protein
VRRAPETKNKVVAEAGAVRVVAGDRLTPAVVAAPGVELELLGGFIGDSCRGGRGGGNEQW